MVALRLGGKFMYVQVPSQLEEYQRIMLERVHECRKWETEHLSAERLGILWNDANHISIKVGMYSIRAKELLERLHKDVFSGFEMVNPSRNENGVWTAWFGFSYPVSGLQLDR
jgi:hypothetical protein